ncbi:hypothetical protein ACSBR2_032140 [Camellia fascicularis]
MQSSSVVLELGRWITQERRAVRYEKPRWFRRFAGLRQDSLTAWLGDDCWICADRWDSSTTCREINGSRFGAQKVYKQVCAPHAGQMNIW